MNEQIGRSPEVGAEGTFRSLSENLSNVPIEVIDENDPQNIFSNTNKDFVLNLKTTYTPVSSEGFHRSIEGQKAIAGLISAKFAGVLRMGVLDVGFGENIYLISALAKQGINVCAIDIRRDPTWERVADSTRMGEFNEKPFLHEPRKETEFEGIEIFSGSIARISNERSHLRSRKFGLVLFNGSWHSTGNNYTIYKDIQGFGESVDKMTTLRGCADHLAENGLIGIISPRYAYHGEGYPYGDWPVEKEEFAKLFLKLQSLGAKRFFMIGLSREGFDAIYKRSYENVDEERKQVWAWRTDVSVVKRKLDNFRDSFPAQLPNEFHQLTRLDALFAQF